MSRLSTAGSLSYETSTLSASAWGQLQCLTIYFSKSLSLYWLAFFQTKKALLVNRSSKIWRYGDQIWLTHGKKLSRSRQFFLRKSNFVAEPKILLAARVKFWLHQNFGAKKFFCCAKKFFRAKILAAPKFFCENFFFFDWYTRGLSVLFVSIFCRIEKHIITPPKNGIFYILSRIESKQTLYDLKCKKFISV